MTVVELVLMVHVSLSPGVIDEEVTDTASLQQCMRAAGQETGKNYRMVWSLRRDPVTQRTYWYSKVNDTEHYECRHNTQ